MNITSRSRLIVEKLLDNYKVTALGLEFLAQTLNMSERTVQRSLNELKTILSDYNLYIVSENGEIKLSGFERDIRLFENDLYRLEFIDLSVEERQLSIILYLVQTDSYLNVETISENLNVSVNTVYRDLSEIEVKFSIEIEKEPGKGIKLIANELQRRNLLKKILDEKELDYFLLKEINHFELSELNDLKLRHKSLRILETDKLIKIHDRLKIWRKELGYEITDDAYVSILMHTYIALMRIKDDNYLQLNQHVQNYENMEAYSILLDLLKSSPPESEVIYLDRYLSTVRMMEEQHKSFKQESFVARQYALQITRDVEKQLNMHIEDYQLIEGLSMHIQSSMARIEEGLRIKNPLSKAIKKDELELFMIIKESMGQIISEQEGLDDEVAFVLMHIKAAILRKEEEVNYSALVICSSGIGTSRMLISKLKQKFPQIKHFESSSVYEANRNTQINNYDLIVSTVPLMNMNVEHLVVSPVLNNSDVARIKKILDKRKPNKILDSLEEFTIKNLEESKEKLEFIIELINSMVVHEMEEANIDELLRALLYLNLLPYPNLDIENIMYKTMENEHFFRLPSDRSYFTLIKDHSVEEAVFQIIQVKGKFNIYVVLLPIHLENSQTEVLSYLSTIILELDHDDMFNKSKKEIKTRLNEYFKLYVKENLFDF